MADERELAGAGLGESVRHGEDGAVVLGDEPTPVSLTRGIGQVTVLVQNGGQRANLLVEGEVGQAGQRAVDPTPAA
jgi:hypothetical protein